jgi:hypothetical protein
MIELEHSPLGGSGAHRFMTCSYSFLKQREEIEAGTFEDVPSEFAALGVAAHEVGAKAIATGCEPFEFLSEEFNGYRVGWPEEISLDAVHVYFNECMGILAARRYPGRMLIEETIHLPHIHPLFKGTVDFAWWAKVQGIFLRDYKNGEGIGVEAPNNRQLLYYAALLIMSDPYLSSPSADRNLPVNLGIVQPNFYGIYEDVIPWVTTLGYVLDWFHTELLPRMNDLSGRPVVGYTEEDAVPGDHCQFCPVLLSCPKMQRAFEEYATASEDFIAMLTNAELDHYYSQIEYARRFMNVLKQTVKARKLTGGDIPSAKLVEPQTARVWKPGGIAAIEAAFGEKAYVKKPLSPAGVEKLSSRGKELALEYGYKPDSAGLTVAPLSDRRPEVKPRGNAGVYAEHAAAQMEDF